MSSAIRFTPTVDSQSISRGPTVPDYNTPGWIMWWVYISVDTGANAVICRIANQDNPFLANYDVLYLDATRHVKIRRQTDVGNTEDVGSQLSVGTYAHLTMAWSTTGIDVYLNSVLDKSITLGLGGPRPASAFMRCGATFSDGSDPFNGRLSGGRTGTGAITPAEILTEMASETAVKAAPWADWRTIAGATRTDDSSGNARHWTGQGTLTDEAGPTYGAPPPPPTSTVVTVTATDPLGRTGTRTMTLQ